MGWVIGIAFSLWVVGPMTLVIAAVTAYATLYGWSNWKRDVPIIAFCLCATALSAFSLVAHDYVKTLPQPALYQGELTWIERIYVSR
jgi:hypothetical protein